MIIKRKLRITLGAVFTFFLGLFLGINVTLMASSQDASFQHLDYFHRVYQLIRAEYVDPAESKDLFYGAIRGMIKALDDPFTRFLDEKDYEELKEFTSGKFVGVGIQVTERDNSIVVITPMHDSPAMRAGIEPGDIIRSVDGVELKGSNLTEVIKNIKGDSGTTVKLGIERKGYDERIDFMIERAPIKVDSVRYGMIEGTDVGYLKILTFNADTTKDSTEALVSLKKKGATRLILDLRNNPGGVLTGAIGVSELFLESGKTIVSTKGRTAKENAEKFVSEKEPMFRDSMVILVNGGSASASEIVSGALRDNKRSILIGQKTFGKGSVQKTYQLDENVGIALTIAKYYTPAGTLIHGKGITPDNEVEAFAPKDDEKKEIQRLFNSGDIAGFVKGHGEYTDESKEIFVEYLKDKGYKLSDETAGFLFKQNVYRYKKSPLYDLEYDLQLKAALDKVRS